MKFLVTLALTVLTVAAHAQWGDGRGRDRRDDRGRDRNRGESVTCTMVTPNYRFTANRWSCQAAYRDVLNQCLDIAYSRRGEDRRQTEARCHRAGYPSSKYALDCFSNRGGGDLFPNYCN